MMVHLRLWTTEGMLPLCDTKLTDLVCRIECARRRVREAAYRMPTWEPVSVLLESSLASEVEQLVDSMNSARLKHVQLLYSSH